MFTKMQTFNEKSSCINFFHQFLKNVGKLIYEERHCYEDDANSKNTWQNRITHNFIKTNNIR